MCCSTNHQTVASFPGNECIYEYSIKVKTNPNYSEESDAERHLRRRKKKKRLLWCAGGVRFCPLVIKGPWLDNSQVQTWLRKQLGGRRQHTSALWSQQQSGGNQWRCLTGINVKKWKNRRRFFFFLPQWLPSLYFSFEVEWPQLPKWTDLSFLRN